jgi:hypothetical protein
MLLVWVAVALVLVIALVYELGKWRALSTEGARVAAERERLTKAIRATEAEIVKEMRASAGLLQEMQWTSAGGDPAAFLTRLADLVQEKRMRVNSIGALERSTTAQFSKTWHTVSVVAPYREVRELATRVESEKGILEDMVLEPLPTGPNRPPSDEVQARFKMTALELTPEAQKVFDRSLAAAGPAPAAQAPGGPQLALAVPSKPDEVPATARDPFAFGPGKRVVAATGKAGPAPARSGSGKAGAPAAAGTPKPPKPEVAFELRGIVGFPGGQLAILNNQIVKPGDVVSGWRVERITDNSVLVKDPSDGETRTLPLPDLLGAAQAGPRR